MVSIGMDAWITLTEHNWAFWIAGLFALLEFAKWIYGMGEWLFSKCGIETKNMRTKRETSERLTKAEQDIMEIKDTAKANVTMFIDHEKKVIDSFLEIKSEVVNQLNGLNNKFDEQKSQLEETLESIDSDGKRRDCSLMRDRLIQGLRYFSQQKDENGIVHISMTDYENLNEMFTEYFNCNGNGVCHSLYENEFKKFKIDTDRKY